MFSPMDGQSEASTSTPREGDKATKGVAEKGNDTEECIQEEQEADDVNSSSWWGAWGGIVEATKSTLSKSTEIYDIMKKDIGELSSAVTTESKKIVDATTTKIRDHLRLDDEESTLSAVKRGISEFMTHVHDAFAPMPPSDDEDEAFIMLKNEPVMLSREQAQVYNLRRDPSTYLLDPEDMKDYNTWLQTFDLEKKQAEMSSFMVDCPEIQKNYSSLVPAQVSHVVFWHRYFYKLDKLEKMEEKRQELKQRAEKPQERNLKEWEDDDDFDIPEEVQDQLLAAYQAECDQGNGRNEFKELEKEDMVVIEPQGKKKKKKKDSGS